MSAIFGIFYRDGRPVEHELETMYSGMAHFPHESHGFVKQGNCGFGHMLTYNTPEAVHETMPKWIEASKLLFVAEGRIDNRDELFEALGTPSNEQAEMPDGDLILAAYMKWGEKCVDRLLGKFSFAAFHTDDQRLFVARDKLDYSNVDYYADDKVFAFAASFKGILPLPFVKTEIDEIKVARLLMICPGDYEKTYFKGVNRIQPAHTLSATREDMRVSRYWNPADIPERRGLKLEEYCEDLLDNLNKSVAARLRSYKPVASTLSGGMDSSTVSILAAEQLAKQGKRLCTYTHVPQFAPTTSLSPRIFGDERPFAEAVVKASGNIDPVFFNSASISPIQGVVEALRLCGEPFHGEGNAYWMVDLYKTVAQEGFGTLLMGEMGNATISQKGVEDGLPVAEIVRRFGTRGFVRKKMLKPVLLGDNPLGKLYCRVTKHTDVLWKRSALLSQSAIQSLNIAERMKTEKFLPPGPRHFGNQRETTLFMIVPNSLRFSIGSRFGCETGLELRDPTNDIRVFKSALSIPNAMFLGKMNKWVLRTMMKGRLPDKLRLNDKKGLQSADLPARLFAHREEMDRTLSEMDASGFGRIADLDRIHHEWEKLKAACNTCSMSDAAPLLRLVAVYFLYREHGQSIGGEKSFCAEMMN